MRKESFNKDWICYQTGKTETAFTVSVPHDAMLLDKKGDNSVGGVNNGWIEAEDYTYEKTFVVPEKWRELETVFYFEGVYHKATIYLNGEKVCRHDYGYTGFFVNVSGKLRYGEDNTLTVEAVNRDQPNSRWYSGTGIYRPVWLYLLPKQHICLQGIRITTLDYRKPEIRVHVKTTGSGKVKAEIMEYRSREVLWSAEGETDGKFQRDMVLEGAKCWDEEHPNLYTCRVSYGEDVQEEHFGIRMIGCDTENGFTINGKRVIIRGACIHHDNGVLGACAYDFAEYRKIRILKENGYNAVRSAHNPCSEAMLRACDELGMLMMDEYVDVWYIHKTKNDYATEVEAHYKEDLKTIVDKDYNHPSVVLYSTGNEVSETAQKRGIKLCGELTERLHELDGTRPVTCGINIFFNFLSSMGFGVYSDKKAEQEVRNVKKKKAVGSEFFNTLAGLMGSEFMKSGATLYPCDVKTRDAFAAMDVAGYNYGIKRYEHDLKKYPKRLILGSETFCSDAYKFWEIAKKNPRIIGDFVWSGMDYLGEVGIGSWEYKDYAPDFSHGKGWVSAGSGRIDLTGRPLAEMTYTKVAFELENIGIGVIPVPYAKQKHSPSAWKMTNAVESWSWRGCAGKETQVEVYARADHVSLFVNGKCVGTKKPEGDCRVIFKTVYQDGSVKAVAYDAKDCVIAEKELKTAGRETVLTVKPEQKCINREDLCYVRLQYTDREGTVKPLMRGDITVHVDGGRLLGLGSACPYYEKSYLGNVTDTYYGEALAVIKPDGEGRICVTAESKHVNGRAEIEVVSIC
ncbi:MAG: glycoside hydrolase family 2 TIM barrel-domain containing protein [Eubacteriales bacterium]|nr:glycoside hydrolase family 2 TIM barrel-domain containing protein [Eubacteriales bacterium]